MFDIVKREHIRRAGFLVLRTSDGHGPFGPDVFGKQNVFGENRRQVFLIACVLPRTRVETHAVLRDEGGHGS